MKKIILSLSLIAVSLSSSAAVVLGNGGPQAVPTQPPAVIAEVATASFFGPFDSELSIFSDGTVQYSQGRGASIKLNRVLAKLSPDAIASLAAKINALQSAPLVDPSPQSMGCQDAPTTTYLVMQNSGVSLKLEQMMSCKDYRLADPTHEETEIIALLNGLGQLAQLSQ